MTTTPKKDKKGFLSGIIEAWARHSVVIGIVFLILAILFPIVFNKQYIITIAINCLMFSILSLSLNLITGFMGITSLGHAAFFGVGAYTAAILSTRMGLGFIATAILGTVFAAVFGILLGLPTLRIKGRYLAIVTLGFCEIMRIVELNWMSLTRGPQGIAGIPKVSFFGFECTKPIQKYYAVLVLLVITVLIIMAIMNSRMGRAMSSIRDDETAADAMGINVFKYKIMVFSISAGIAGLAGAYYAHYMGFIDPNAFNFDQSILMLSMTIMGGMASIPGSIFGATILSVLPEVLRAVNDYRQIVYGLLLAVMVVWKPSGILGGFNLKHIRQRLEMENKNNSENREAEDNV
ncbi:high-affinity branched-chain amino acid transport system permease protein LivH [Clostridiales bacterium]|nr:high-affinity branched-chain amino acid transport system permease protein LivH [Clostridiales bacterium]